MKKIFFLLCLFSWAASAELTTAQKATVKADIIADGTLNAFPQNSDGASAIAEAYNLPASPDFYVWRTKVTEAEVVGTTSAEATVWSWPAYIARSVAERDCWDRLFAANNVNASLPQVRSAFTDIFSGSANSAPAQRTHLAAIAKRKATRIEKLLATGTGSQAVPATMGFEGPVSYPQIETARQ